MLPRAREIGLAPHNGVVDVPCWLFRPGEVSALERVTDAMPVWGLVASINGPSWMPCIAADDTLAATMGTSRSTVQRRLASLRRVKGLMIEIPRTFDPRTGRVRPRAKWAIDPMYVAKRSPSIIIDKLMLRLGELAELDGAGERWLEQAGKLVRRHDAHARRLADAMRPDLLATVLQYDAVRGGGRGGGEPLPLSPSIKEGHLLKDVETPRTRRKTTRSGKAKKIGRAA